MDFPIANILQNIKHLDVKVNEELHNCIFDDEHLKIYSIISNGYKSPEHFWYEQEEDEWLYLVQGNAKLEYEDGSIINLNTGSYLHLPAYIKHRIIDTSSQPLCIWLTIHWKKS